LVKLKIGSEKYVFYFWTGGVCISVTLFSIETMVVQCDVGRVTAGDKFFNRPYNLTETPMAT
jgi:hypothetical protein